MVAAKKKMVVIMGKSHHLVYCIFTNSDLLSLEETVEREV